MDFDERGARCTENSVKNAVAQGKNGKYWIYMKYTLVPDTIFGMSVTMQVVTTKKGGHQMTEEKGFGASVGIGFDDMVIFKIIRAGKGHACVVDGRYLL